MSNTTTNLIHFLTVTKNAFICLFSLSNIQYCRDLGGENWKTDYFLGIIFRSVVTHAFSLVIFTQDPKPLPRHSLTMD